METAFGRFIRGKLFGRLFFIMMVAGVLGGAAANASALETLTGSLGLAGAAGGIYLAAGILVIWQKRITEKWPDRVLEMAIGFSACFIIYNLLLLIFWKICAFILPVSETADAGGVICVDVVTAAAVTGGYLHTKKIKTPSYSIDLGMKGPDYHIVLLSDIHLGVFVRAEHVRRIVGKVNAMEADVVVISGDIIDVNHQIMGDPEALEEIGMELAKIRAKEGVFAVACNHDPDVGNPVFTEFLRRSQIRLLYNEAVWLSRINLVGRTDGSHHERLALETLAGKIDRSMPVVILDHDPCNIPEAVRFGADLVLSGHTHRGQFFPVTFFTKLANGSRYFYGHEVFGKTHAIITSGAGFFQLPVRIGTDDEVVDICLS